MEQLISPHESITTIYINANRDYAEYRTETGAMVMFEDEQTVASIFVWVRSMEDNGTWRRDNFAAVGDTWHKVVN